jgi:hypothetical protein
MINAMPRIKSSHPKINQALDLLTEKAPQVLNEIEKYVDEICVPETYHSVESRRRIEQPGRMNLIFTSLSLEPSELAGLIISEGMRIAYYLKQFGPCDTELLPHSRKTEIEIETQSLRDELKALPALGAPTERIELVLSMIKSNTGDNH